MKQIRVERTIRLFAPAKVNLGLEIIGRRDDGYHEVVTALQSVSLFDVIDLAPADSFSFASDSNVDTDQDLTLRAIRLFETRFGVEFMVQVRLEKDIPIAAGLGGGSSDAGTLLAALAVLAEMEPEQAEGLAAELGSDVPFFVHGGTALATGTGTDLTPLPSPPRAWFVIVTPQIEIPNKTARLYAGLRPEDFSDGASTREIARSIESGKDLRLSSATNAFSRLLYEMPEIESARKRMLDLGAPFVIPCGAGPSLFTCCDRWEDARELAARLRDRGCKAVACTSIGRACNLGRLI